MREVGEKHVSIEPLHEFGNAFSGLEIAEEKWPGAPDFLRIAMHRCRVYFDIRREVDLIDDEQVAVRDGGPAFAGNVFAFGYVDDVDENGRRALVRKSR